MKIKTYASGSIGNLYTIDDGETKLILEAGLSYKKIIEKLDWRISCAHGVLITHEHR